MNCADVREIACHVIGCFFGGSFKYYRDRARVLAYVFCSEVFLIEPLLILYDLFKSPFRYYESKFETIKMKEFIIVRLIY